MYGTSGAIEMPPPASRQASPAIQRRPLGPSDNQAPGPALGGISITPDVPNMNHTCIYMYIWYMVYGIWYMVYGIWYTVYGIWYTVYGIWYMVYGI